jgi:hypothetical protein
MSSVYISDGHCRVIKPHRCRVCDEMIKKGEECHTYRGIERGEGFYTLYFHNECWVYSREWESSDWDILPGSVTRKEVRKEIKW